VTRREDDDRRGEESDRRMLMHEYERHIARQPEQPGPGRPDPIHVLRVRFAARPGTEFYYLARWSLIARLRRDAGGSGDRLEDLGPDAMEVARAAQRGEWAPGDLASIGVARGARWLRWDIPRWWPEPVPGMPEAEP
jgi:hypothetical protein